MHLVDSSVWLLMASMLATLTIAKAVDEQGNVVEPVIKFENAVFRWVVLVSLGFFFLLCVLTMVVVDGMCRTPSKFECDMRPRSPKALSLIEQAEMFSA
jgi:hypothetical protein